jgi:hypothetical protein
MAMLPLLTRICQNIKSNSVSVTKLTLNKEGDDQDIVEWQLARRAEEYADLKQEVADLKGKICHSGRGLVDMPVWHPHLAEVVHVCVDSDSKADNLEAHLVSHKPYRREFFWSLQPGD